MASVAAVFFVNKDVEKKTVDSEQGHNHYK